MKLLRDIWQGAGYLEGFGNHPGNIYLVLLVLAGALAGVKGGLTGVLVGTFVMLLFVLPSWCIGCIGRAREYQAKEKNK